MVRRQRASCQRSGVALAFDCFDYAPELRNDLQRLAVNCSFGKVGVHRLPGPKSEGEATRLRRVCGLAVVRGQGSGVRGQKKTAG